MDTRPMPALGAPIVFEPRRVEAGTPVRGRRVIIYDGEGFVRDFRAMAPPWLHEDGRLLVRVCHESAWYKWCVDGVEPSEHRDYHADCVWVEG